MKHTSTPHYDLIVHSHLGWDWVWQRPQQLLSRMSKRRRVLFVEGPQLRDNIESPYFTLREAAGYSNLTIMNTFFPANRFHDGPWVDAERRRLLDDALAGPLKGKFERPVQWFYDPMAHDCHAGHHGEIAAVYDCMDELSKFKFAPPELVIRERKLLAHADVVFAGGRKMWESKSRHNANCHFYGCGVDAVHFGKSRLSSTTLPEDVARLSGPVLGYVGVVDERLDYELIARLADAHKDWHVVIVGPACKVDPEDFPKRDNLHWLGGRSYDELPAYCKAFDVCLMPFALNEHTEYINPTKTLEYMACGKPIVSTPVPDVVANFASVVFISTGDDFVKDCRDQACEPNLEAVARGLKMANENSWDGIVSKMETHIERALARKVVTTAVAGKLSSLYEVGYAAGTA